MNKIALIFLTITGLIAYFIGTMFIPVLFVGLLPRVFAWLIHLSLFSIVFLGPFISRSDFKLNQKLHQFLQFCSYTLMGFYMIFLFFLICKSIVLIWVMNLEVELTLLSLIMSIVTTFLGFFVTLKKPSLINVGIKLPPQALDLNGLKMVQLSDVHVSGTIKKPFVEKIVAEANAQNPDLILLTGDFIDGLPEDLREDLSPFKNLKSKYGVFYCPGNHEYYWGFENWMQEFRNLNFEVLLNQAKIIQIGNNKIAVGGVHDLASHRINKNYQCNPDVAFENCNEVDYKILLAHQPKSVHLIKKAKVDLVLSGHTHAGQFFPGSLFIFLFQPYVKGLHLINGIQMYINQGTGYWGPPNRFGTKSEITILTLQS